MSQSTARSPVILPGLVSLPQTAAAEFRMRAYRMLLTAAGAYDLVLAVGLGIFTHHLFGWMGMEIPGQPLTWRVVAVGLCIYGLLYLHAARRLERARPIIGVGLIGKGLMFAALLAAAASGAGDVAWRMLPLVAVTSLIWWIPFAALLLEDAPIAGRVRAATPWVCAGLHGAAGLAMLFILRGGTEAQPDLAERIAYLGAHTAAWRGGFAVWMAAGMSVLALYAWWAASVRNWSFALAALALGFAGLACDLSGEALYMGWLPSLTGDAAAFEHVQRVGTVLTALFANGFYTAAGVVLTVGTPGLSRGFRALAWTIWAAGVALSICGAIGWSAGLVAASGVLFPGLMLLSVLLPRELR